MKQKRVLDIDIENELREKDFSSLAKLIRLCIKNSDEIINEEKHLVTQSKTKLLEYLKILESKIKQEPEFIPPIFKRRSREEVSRDENIKYLSRTYYKRIEALRYNRYIDQVRLYERKHAFSPKIKLIQLQKRIVTGLKNDIENPLNAIKVSWQFLPVGANNRILIFEHFKRLERRYPHIRYDSDRLERILSIYPNEREIYTGTDEFERYIAVHYPQIPLTILECPVFGNAIYIFYRNWKYLSRLTKYELLENYPHDVTRIVHKGDWFFKLKSFIAYRKSRNK